MRLENTLEQATISGTMAKMSSVSGTLVWQRMQNDATILMIAMNSSSGKWWANSVMSFRSVVMRDMSWPIFAVS